MTTKVVALILIGFISLFGFAAVVIIIQLKPNTDNSQLITVILAAMGTIITSLLSYVQSAHNAVKIGQMQDTMNQQRQSLDKNTDLTAAIANKMVVSSKGEEKAATDNLDAALNSKEAAAVMQPTEQTVEFQ